MKNRKINLFLVSPYADKSRSTEKKSSNQQHIPTDSNEFYFGTENNKLMTTPGSLRNAACPIANAMLVFLRENEHDCSKRQRSTKSRLELGAIFRYNTALNAERERKNCTNRWISSVDTNVRTMKAICIAKLGNVILNGQWNKLEFNE